jgi:hypothetical protein
MLNPALSFIAGKTLLSGLFRCQIGEDMPDQQLASTVAFEISARLLCQEK